MREELFQFYFLPWDNQRTNIKIYVFLYLIKIIITISGIDGFKPVRIKI